MSEGERREKNFVTNTNKRKRATRACVGGVLMGAAHSHTDGSAFSSPLPAFTCWPLCVGCEWKRERIVHFAASVHLFFSDDVCVCM
jgi:hypothetical protein